jgi:hypothetical protein
VTTPARDASRRARLLVLGALAAAVATSVLLVLLLLGRGGTGPVLGVGLAAFGTAALAGGLLVLARAGALARDVAGAGRERAAAVLTRCLLATGAVAAVALVVGIAAAVATRSAAPGLGAAIAVLLLALLAATAYTDRAAALSGDPDGCPGAAGASEPDPAADAR